MQTIKPTNYVYFSSKISCLSKDNTTWEWHTQGISWMVVRLTALPEVTHALCIFSSSFPHSRATFFNGYSVMVLEMNQSLIGPWQSKAWWGCWSVNHVLILCGLWQREINGFSATFGILKNNTNLTYQWLQHIFMHRRFPVEMFFWRFVIRGKFEKCVKLEPRGRGSSRLSILISKWSLFK